MPTELKVVLFTDQVKSTLNTARRTPAEIEQVTREHGDLTTKVAQRYRGTILKDTGDGYFMQFSSLRDAVLLGFILQQRVKARKESQTNENLRFELHIGIDLGELVVLPNGDLRGNAANLAARVCSECPPGEVYFTEKVKIELNSREVEVAEVGTVALEGVPEKVTLYRLIKWLGTVEPPASHHQWVVGSEVADKVDQLLHEYQSKIVVGREEAFTRIDRLITEKPCGTLMITAKAGFGKTAVLADWMKRRQNRACSIAYHFFNQRHEVTLSLISAYRNLLRQLFVYYGLPEKALPGDEAQLREMLYDMLSRGGHTHKPLVLLLDGIDEAQSPFSPPFPVPTPTGMFVIFSARADEREEPEYLRLWMPDAERLHLDSLSSSAIVDWLRQSGCAELTSLAEDESFVKKIEETTEGFPLYLSFLIDEIAQAAKAGGDIRTLLEHSPQGFSSYVREQLRLIAQIEEVKSSRKVQDLFAFLSVAKGQLLQNDVEQLTGLSVWELETLPWQVRRWMTVHTVESLCFYALAHPLLAREFQNALGREAQQAKDKLLEYCSRWREHHSPYALRFYDEHLRDGSQCERLFDLARDEDFRQAQVAAFPADPNIALKTTQTALEAAADTDKAGAMTEFLLGHAKILHKLMSSETPLDAFRENNYAKALKLADNYREPLPVLWKLLIAWLLDRNGKTDTAKQALRELRVRRESKLVAWIGNLAALLLSHLKCLEEQDLVRLAVSLLSPYQLTNLSIYLAKQHENQSFSLALRLIPFIGKRKQARMLGKVVLELAQVGRWAEALSYTTSIEDVWERAWALCNLSSLALEQQDIQKAEDIIKALQKLQTETKGDLKGDLRWQIAQSLARLGVRFHIFGKQEEPLKILQRARDVAITGAGRSFFKGHAIADVAKAYAQIGQSQHAASAFENAIYMAGSINVPRESARLLCYIAQALSGVGMSERALGILEKASLLAGKIPDLYPRSEVLQEIAIAYTTQGRLDAATTIATKIAYPHYIASVLAEIAKVLAEKGEFDLAYNLSKNKSAWTKAWLLSEIGTKLLERGSLDRALDIWREALAVQAGLVYGGSGLAPQLTSALAKLARAYLDSGDRDRGKELIRRAVATTTDLPSQIRILYLIDLADSVARAQDIETGRNLLERAYDEASGQKRDDIKVWLLAGTAETASRLGLTEFAKGVFKEAISVAEQFSDPSQKVKALGELGEKLTSAGNTDHAKVILETAHKIADAIELYMVRTRSLAALALAYAKAGIWDAAESLASTKGVSTHKDARRAMTLVYLSQGLTDKAFEEARRITDPKVRARALSDTAVYALKQKRTMEALQIAQTITSSREIELHRIASSAAKNRDKNGFKRLLVPNAHFFGSAYIVVGLLAQLYPAQARDIEMILESELSHLYVETNDPEESGL